MTNNYPATKLALSLWLIAILTRMWMINAAGAGFGWKLIAAGFYGATLVTIQVVVPFVLLLSLPKRYKKIALIASTVVLATVLSLEYADLITFYVSKTRINSTLLRAIHLSSILAYLTFDLLRTTMAFIGIVSLSTLSFFISRGAWEAKRKDSYRLISSVLIALGATLILCNAVDRRTFYEVPPGWEGWYEAPLNRLKDDISTTAVLAMADSLNLTHGHDQVSIEPTKALEYTTDELRSLEGKFLVSYNDRLNGELKFKKIVILFLESFARDFISNYNEKIPKSTMPFLSSILDLTTSYENYWTTNIASEQGIYSTFFSRPLYDPLLTKQFQVANLASLAQDHGYRTAYGIPASEFFGDYSWLIRDNIGISHFFGFETLRKKYPKDPVTHWGFTDASLFKEVIQIWKSWRKEQFLIGAATIDSHPPYVVGEKSSDFPDNKFLNALRWQDKCLSQFFQQIIDEKLLDSDTLLVITADHSPTHGTSDKWTRQKNYMPDRIPLIFMTPRKELHSKLSSGQLSSQLDFAPTLLDLMGIEKPPSFWGRSLLQPQRREIAISHSKEGLVIRFGKRGPKMYPYQVSEENLGSAKVEDRAILKWISNQRAMIRGKAL